MSDSPGATILYIPHGGGPLPLLGEPSHQALVSFLQTIATEIPRPEAIIVVSAHWETANATVTSGSAPELIYDYYGFPEESYQIQYPAAGHPQLAGKIQDALDAAGIANSANPQRGFDHGLFIPLKLMYPDADIPCIQLSLLSSLNASAHLELGKTLRTLNMENVLVLGSGLSFHNMQSFRDGPNRTAPNLAFEQWLNETCCAPRLSPEERYRRLASWDSAPGARYCHPREEHLLPLHVCAGMAQGPATRVFFDDVMEIKTSAYLWPPTNGPGSE